MRLIEDSASILSVRQKMVRHDAMYLKLPAYLEVMVQTARHNLSCICIGYGVDVEFDKDAHRLLELMDLYRA